MKPIIIATDLSYSSINAANFGADMAVGIKADILLLHVIQVPVLPYPIPKTEFELHELRRGVEAGLTELRRNLQLRTDHSISISYEIRFGRIDIELHRLCLEINPFVVLMGLKKKPGVVRQFLGGGNAWLVMRRLPFPVLLVPEDCSYKGIRNISLASDLHFTKDLYPLIIAKEWLAKFHISPDFIYINSGYGSENDIVPGLSFLQRSFEGFKPRFHFIKSESIHAAISEFALENHSDLVVVMPEPHGSLQSIFHVSQSRQIALHSAIPVLSITGWDPKDEKAWIAGREEEELRRDGGSFFREPEEPESMEKKLADQTHPA